MKEVAAAVGLAPSSAHGRIKQLRAAGVLRGAHVDVDPEALGIGLEALFMIELSKHERSTVDDILDELVKLPEVRFAFLVSGRYDLESCTSFSDVCVLVVVAPLEGSPAEAAGLQPGDVVEAVDGESVDGMTLDQAVKIVRGEAGTGRDALHPTG